MEDLEEMAPHLEDFPLRDSQWQAPGLPQTIRSFFKHNIHLLLKYTFWMSPCQTYFHCQQLLPKLFISFQLICQLLLRSPWMKHTFIVQSSKTLSSAQKAKLSCQLKRHNSLVSSTRTCQLCSSHVLSTSMLAPKTLHLVKSLFSDIW